MIGLNASSDVRMLGRHSDDLVVAALEDPLAPPAAALAPSGAIGQMVAEPSWIPSAGIALQPRRLVVYSIKPKRSNEAFAIVAIRIGVAVVVS